jgi:hypothetical protein
VQEEVVALLRQESKGAPVRIPAPKPRRRVRVRLAAWLGVQPAADLASCHAQLQDA